jgi:putative FmdB family regulatory protein
MPTYEYACKQCGHRFEQMQSITAKALKKCPSCGKKTLQRLFGAGAGFIFKGSGFYATDYRSDNYTQGKKLAEGSGTTKTKDSGESSAKKTESKESSSSTSKESSSPAPTPTPTPPPAPPKENARTKKSDAEKKK